MQLDISGLESYRTEIAQAATLDALYQVKVKYLGKNGLISNLNRQLKDISSHEDKKRGGNKKSVRSVRISKPCTMPGSLSLKAPRKTPDSPANLWT
ncbi:MAG: hypothetical protein LRY51_16015 [Geovibrio sp.]|nr:hypothetical protein [Geovibrio sp.]